MNNEEFVEGISKVSHLKKEATTRVKRVIDAMRLVDRRDFIQKRKKELQRIPRC